MAADPGCPIDLMLGKGGASEGLLTACAVKILGGAMLARLSPMSDEERTACEEAGHDLARVLTCGDMIAGEDIFISATGVTDTQLLRGVRYHGDFVDTQSLVLRSETGTRRLVNTEHRLA